MKVKRYVAETAQEALQKVRMDLGRDAIILNTRKIRKKGIAGFFSKPLIEVVATIDSDISDNTTKKTYDNRGYVQQPQIKQPPVATPNEGSQFLNELNASIKNQAAGAIPYTAEIIPQEVGRPQEAVKQQESEKPAEKTESTENPEMPKEEVQGKMDINEIKKMINKVYDAVKTDYENIKLSEVARAYLRILENNEVDKTIINDIKEDMIDILSSENQENEYLVKETIYELLNNYMKDPEPYSFTTDKKVVIFIGPTGVGKTTTLAKLAANMVLSEKKRVGLITSDTYRIAAVEQLKTYSEIIGVPLTIIYAPSEMQNAINSYKDYDLILVDTAGRSHKDKYQLMELKSLINSSLDFEVYLVMSATTKFSDCIEIIKNYGFLEDYKLVFTKLDETSSLGVILNVAYITKKPLSYITTGQSVPDDIEVADKDKIINCLIGDNLYERSS